MIRQKNSKESITNQFFKQLEIEESDIVLFKTGNSKISKQAQFTQNYVYLESAAAKHLAQKKPRIVGIDYISIDSYEAEDLPCHKILLSNEILILEGLDLKNCPAGRCEIFVVPLHIPDMDGLPARVFCKF